ncbi:MAG: hypothetical protein MJE77_01735 [Proteobacteria bacterium]|nr:hypothetical protein [Pseudomonadota bacterium]
MRRRSRHFRGILSQVSHCQKGGQSRERARQGELAPQERFVVVLVDLSADGKPAALPALGPFEHAHVAADDRSVLSVGPGMSDELASLLATKPGQNSPLARLVVDLDRLANVIESQDPRTAAMLSDYRRGEVSFYVTGSGVVFRVHGLGQARQSQKTGKRQVAGR